MPLPSATGIAKPVGVAGHLTVLDWAGFKAAASFSFDDALASQIANYSALQATGVHLTFYLISTNNATSPVWAQAQKDGHELGNHTAHHCHADGTACGGVYAGSIEAELDQCTNQLVMQYGAPVWTAASPYGDSGYDVPDSTRFLVNRGVVDGQIAPNDNTSPFELPAHVAGLGEMAASLEAAVDSARSNGTWQLFVIHSLGGDGGYNPVLTSDVVATIEHGKSAGDVWTDSVVNVAAYWRAQKLFSALTPAISGDATTWTWTLPSHFPPGHYLRVRVDGGTLRQANAELAWSEHGFYEVALDAGSLTLTP